jgi:hypothetical protein
MPPNISHPDNGPTNRNHDTRSDQIFHVSNLTKPPILATASEDVLFHEVFDLGSCSGSTKLFVGDPLVQARVRPKGFTPGSDIPAANESTHARDKLKVRAEA